MSSQGLTCHEVVELVTDYLEGALPDEVRHRVEEHLSNCDGCTRYLAQMRETIRLTGMLTEEQIPEEQKSILIEAFRGWAHPSPPGSRGP
jgi:predicted anti-sigma-YlaC factor YlaD